MKIPETMRYGMKTRDAIEEIETSLDGETDTRGLTVSGLTHAEIVELAVVELASRAELEPEQVIEAFVDRRLAG